MAKRLIEPVVFQSAKLSLRLQVKEAASERHSPDAALHPDSKWAIFHAGLFQTDDPEIIAFLDDHPDVWRANDPAAKLKAEYGPAEFARLSEEFGAVLGADKPVGEEPAEIAEEQHATE